MKRPETMARHRNPLFNRTIGITPKRCVTVDFLHALYLGVLKVHAHYLLWQIVLSGCFSGPGNLEERVESSRLALKHRLDRWYKARHESNPEEKLTRVTDLTRKMMGDR